MYKRQVEYILWLGIALIVASLTVYLRDLQYILGILVMALQYMTPVMYGSDMVPDWAMPIFRLNPMTPVIEIYRDILYLSLIHISSCRTDFKDKHCV